MSVLRLATLADCVRDAQTLAEPLIQVSERDACACYRAGKDKFAWSEEYNEVKLGWKAGLVPEWVYPSSLPLARKCAEVWTGSVSDEVACGRYAFNWTENLDSMLNTELLGEQDLNTFKRPS